MKKMLPFILLISLSLLLGACGAKGGASTTLNVTMTDFHFTPDTYTVPAGKEITVNLVNNGAVVHEFVIFKLGTTPGDKFEEDDKPNIYWDVQAQPGESKSVTFTAPAAPGEYVVVCGISGHLEAGMKAKLIVVP